jgi:hypothetical protein
MRTRRLGGLALVVLALHVLAWRIAAGGLPRLAIAPAGVHRITLASVPQRVAAASQASPTAPPKAGWMPAPPIAAPARSPAPPRAPALAGVTPDARVPAGDGGARRLATPATPDWPVYPTRPPPSATLRYALVQTGVASAAAGSAELEWRRDAQAFTLRLATAAGERAPREWQSTGDFDAAGVAPLRLVERERGRDRRSLSFDRGAGRVRFSGAPGAPAIARGAQDRWSWIAQLAAIAEAGASRGPPPDHWDLQVAGLRGDLERWTFRVLPPGEPPPELQGGDAPPPGQQAPLLLHVLRATEQPYDLRIEAWLSPALHHLPAGLRMSTPPGPWSLSLWLRSS